MPDTKTSLEGAAAALDGTELVRGVQSAANVKITINQIKTWASASPTLVTPVLGVAAATSVNKVALTAPATAATLTIADGKTLTASNTLTFTGTDASSVAFGAGGTVPYLTGNSGIRSIVFSFNGGGSAITANSQCEIEIPYACTILAATTLLDQSGSIVIDLWKDTYANYPPTVADTITASAKPTVSAATKAQDTTLTGWTTAVAAGDILKANVDSITTAVRATLILKVRVT